MTTAKFPHAILLATEPPHGRTAGRAVFRFAPRARCDGVVLPMLPEWVPFAVTAGAGNRHTPPEVRRHRSTAPRDTHRARCQNVKRQPHKVSSDSARVGMVGPITRRVALSNVTHATP